MNVVDSCGWLEYFADAPNADFFASVIQNTSELVVPSISIFEVFKRVLQQSDEDKALQAIAIMQQGTVVDFDMTIALFAAKLSIELKLLIADSAMLATSRTYNAVLWTQDSDFEGIEGVQYIQKA